MNLQLLKKNKEKLLIYCVTNKDLSFLNKLNYNLAAVGKNKFSDHYIRSDQNDNIFYKEEYYSELTFHYWFWRNKLKGLIDQENLWIGFCQKRRFWSKKKHEKIDQNQIQNSFLNDVPEEWKNFNSVICEPIDLKNYKLTKLIKKGWKNLISDPTILINKNKHTVKLHFDMFHGFGNLEKAINVMANKDKTKFTNFILTETSFNPHIMFISNPKIANLWFKDLFEWLFKCEQIFNFKDLKNYETKRLFAYLAERYLSYWFKEYTNFIEWPYIFYDSEK